MKTPKQTVVLSPVLRRLLHDFQTWCSADCCKARAFQFSEPGICDWLEGERLDRTHELVEEIAKIARGLQQAEGQIVLAGRGLESHWDVGEFRAFWESFTAVFTSALSVRTGAKAEPAVAPDSPRDTGVI